MAKRSRAGIYRYNPMSKWTPARAMRRTRARLEAAKAALIDIGYVWSDVDQGTVDETDRLILELDQLLETLAEVIADKTACGEEVG